MLIAADRKPDGSGEQCSTRQEIEKPPIPIPIRNSSTGLPTAPLLMFSCVI